MFMQSSKFALFCVACAFGADMPSASAKPPKLTSKGTDGGFANSSCNSSQISGDGRYVAFESIADNLSPHDTSDNRTVFLRDHEKGTLEVISVKDDESPITAHSTLAGTSKNGRLVLFGSSELGIDPSASSANGQAYLRDTKLGTTRNVSLDYEGNPIGGHIDYVAMSPNARYIVFTTDAPFVADGVGGGTDLVYLFDRVTNAVECVSLNHNGNVANGDCERPRVSANGRYVFFVSEATGMTADDTNSQRDVFVRDRETATTRLVSKGDSGAIAEGSSVFEISASGKRVAFVSSGAVVGGVSVVDGLYVHDWKAGIVSAAFSSPSLHTIAVNVHVGGFQFSADGKRLVAATPDNLSPSQSGSVADVYLLSPDTGKAKLVTRGQDGGLADDDTDKCAISADGKYVSYTSRATNLVAPGAPPTIAQAYRQKL
jgi:Tol biopolymer transport system component